MANLNDSGSSSLAGLAFNSIILLPLRQDLLRQPPLRESYYFKLAVGKHHDQSQFRHYTVNKNIIKFDVPI